MEKTCASCGKDVRKPVLIMPWENGDNPNAYWECPYCGYENIVYGFGEDDD